MTRTSFIVGAFVLGLLAVGSAVFLRDSGGGAESKDGFRLAASVPLTRGEKAEESLVPEDKNGPDKILVTYSAEPQGVFSASEAEGATTPFSEYIPPPPCLFESAGVPLRQRALINEVAWMGTVGSANDEWLELRNLTPSSIPLSGWQLQDKGADIQILFGEGDVLAGGGFMLLERTDDGSAPPQADRIYAGALSNSDEGLRLWGPGCVLEDEVFASPGWEAGDASSRKTMERNAGDIGWHTSVQAGGTPKAKNSEPPPSIIAPPPSTLPVPEPPPAPPAAPSPAADPPPPPVEAPTEDSPEEEEVLEETPSSAGVIQILISEVQPGTEAGGAEDEFVELYNPTDQAVSLSGFSLKKRSSTGSESNLVSSGAFEGVIPARGFFLIAHKNYAGSVAKDLAYSANSNNLAYANNAVVLYNAAGDEVDQAAWENITKGSSIERKAWVNGACVSASGSGANAGNGCDTGSADDFETRAVPEPQNSAGPSES